MFQQNGVCNITREVEDDRSHDNDITYKTEIIHENVRCSIEDYKPDVKEQLNGRWDTTMLTLKIPLLNIHHDDNVDLTYVKHDYNKEYEGRTFGIRDISRHRFMNNIECTIELNKENE